MKRWQGITTLILCSVFFQYTYASRHPSYVNALSELLETIQIEACNDTLSVDSEQAVKGGMLEIAFQIEGCKVNQWALQSFRRLCIDMKQALETQCIDDALADLENFKLFLVEHMNVTRKVKEWGQLLQSTGNACFQLEQSITQTKEPDLPTKSIDIPLETRLIEVHSLIKKYKESREQHREGKPNSTLSLIAGGLGVTLCVAIILSQS